MLRDVEFQYRHEGCWLQDITESYRDITLGVSTFYKVGPRVHMDVLVHTRELSTLHRVEKALAADTRIDDVVALHEGPHGGRFQVSYDQKFSIYEIFFRHGPLSIAGIRINRGQEFYHLVGEQHAITKTLSELDRIGSLNILSSRQREVVPRQTFDSNHLGHLASLTERQVDLLLAAIGQGYFAWPREVSATELARRLGMSTSSLLQHLRAAEARVLISIAADVRARDRPRYDVAQSLVRRTDSSVRPSDDDA